MKRSSMLFFIMLTGLCSYGQDYRLQLHAKLGYIQTSTWVDGRDIYFSNSLPVSATGEAYFFVRPKIGLGVSYSFASKGDVVGLSGIPDGYGTYQHYGVNAMVTTDRSKRFGIYGVVGFRKAEQNIKYHWFDVANKGTAWTFGFGTVLKITRSISLNLFEVKGIMYSKSFSYGEGKTSYGVHGETGLIFKMIRQR